MLVHLLPLFPIARNDITPVTPVRFFPNPSDLYCHFLAHISPLQLPRLLSVSAEGCDIEFMPSPDAFIYVAWILLQVAVSFWYPTDTQQDDFAKAYMFNVGSINVLWLDSNCFRANVFSCRQVAEDPWPIRRVEVGFTELKRLV